MPQPSSKESSSLIFLTVSPDQDSEIQPNEMLPDNSTVGENSASYTIKPNNLIILFTYLQLVTFLYMWFCNNYYYIIYVCVRIYQSITSIYCKWVQSLINYIFSEIVFLFNRFYIFTDISYTLYIEGREMSFQASKNNPRNLLKCSKSNVRCYICREFFL